MAKESLMESLSLNLPAMAQIIKKKGRGRDTILAHITPEEAKLLKKRGGRGSINPETGLLEFEDFYATSPYGTTDYSGPVAPDYTPQAGVSADYTGGGEVPEGYTPSYTPSTPEIVPSSAAAPGIDYSQYTGAPGVAEYAGAPGVQITPRQQERFLASALPQPTGLQPVVDVGAPPAETQQSVLDRLAQTTGLSKDTLAKLGIGGLTALGGISTTRKAQAQGQKARKDLEAIAKPYQTQGQELIRAAQAGELTPSSQQTLEAARAQIQQGVETRGGVGAAQAANQLANIRNTLLNNQYNYGLQVLGVGDNIAVGAITTGIQADRYVNNLTQNYFTNIARVMAGQPPATVQTQTPPVA